VRHMWANIYSLLESNFDSKVMPFATRTSEILVVGDHNGIPQMAEKRECERMLNRNRFIDTVEGMPRAETNTELGPWIFWINWRYMISVN
jgi:hypothetical protein